MVSKEHTETKTTPSHTIQPCFTDIANLTHESFQKDMADILDRAAEKGIRKIMITGACPASSQAAIALSKKFVGHAVRLYTTTGVHPHAASQFSQNVAQDMVTQAQTERDKIKAIGETGLDFYRDLSPRAIQEHAFHEQLAVAAKVNLPVFLHERDAHQRFFAILKEHRDHLKKVIVHCFTGDKQALFRYLDMDCFIGLTGWITDRKRGSHLLPLIKAIPLDRLLIETDAPYLLPHNINPQPETRRNEPALLPAIFHALSAHRQEAKHMLMQQLYRNADVFFDLT